MPTTRLVLMNRPVRGRSAPGHARIEPERFRRLEEVVLEVLDPSAEARDKRIRRRCEGDATLMNLMRGDVGGRRPAGDVHGMDLHAAAEASTNARVRLGERIRRRVR